MDAAALVAVVAVGLFLRAYFTYDRVFAGDRVVLLSTDPWYHVRLVDGLVRNFPHAIEFDPYGRFPGGQEVPVAPLFDLLLSTVILVAGLGSPSEPLAHAIAAFFPAVLGALVAVPVYFLGRALFGRAAGLLAALLIAVMPGEFIERSLVGYTDHHVAESLLWALVILLLVLALRRTNTVIAALCGVALGAYMLTWAHGALLALVLLVWLVLQHAIEWRAGGSSSVDLLRTCAVVFAGALLTVLPYVGRAAGSEYNVPVTVLGLAVCGGLVVLDRVAARAGMGARGRLAVVGVTAVVGALAAWVAAPGLARSAFGAIGRFSLRPTAFTVFEARPLPVGPAGTLSLAPAWSEFGAGALLLLAGVWLLGRRAWREPRRETTLVLVWTLALLAATTIQIRFSYYLAVNVALLSAFVCVELARTKLPLYVVVPAVAALVVYPSVSLAVARAGAPGGGPHGDWVESLMWLRDSTPEPLGDPSAYTARYGPKESFTYPPSAYGVMNWWDSGYWITAIGRRIPVANPTQAGAPDAARFFVAQDEASGAALLDEEGARYVIVDSNLPILRYPDGDRGAFTTFPLWAGEDAAAYFETYVSRANGRRTEVRCFYPEYYRSMCVRLYCFGGRAVVPNNSTWVITFMERTEESGARVKEILTSQRFATYDEARAFVATQQGQNVRIVGTDPLASCVPLERLERFSLVHGSPSAIGAGQLKLPWVQIYEYTKS